MALTPREYRESRPQRGTYRSFAEWHRLRSWDKLPEWERQVPGYLLRLARKEAQLTQKELAKILGVTQQAVSRAESWRSNPTISFVTGWLNACGFRLELEIKRR